MLGLSPTAQIEIRAPGRVPHLRPPLMKALMFQLSPLLHSQSCLSAQVRCAAPNTVVLRCHSKCLLLVTELASGPAFEFRVKSIFRNHIGNRALLPPDISVATLSSAQSDRPVSQWENATDLVNGVPPPTLLERERSYELFDTFISLLGVNQHFLDSRVFLDSMDLLYHDDSSRSSQMQSIWFTQYLLVMAVAMLIGSPAEGSRIPPGNDLFAEAMRRIPPVHDMGSHGVISVEILCLIALYLQWCDRKHDAYLYVSLRSNR